MKYKILIVDDDVNICELLRLYLEKEGFNRDYLVVEINEIIIPKKNYAQHFFHDGDSVETISFVGGG